MTRINIDLNAVPDTMPFGRHKGEAIEDVPSDYLYWLMGDDIDPLLKKEIVLEYDCRVKNDTHFYSENYNYKTEELDLPEVKI